MNLTQRIKFSLKASKSFIVFIIKIWKSAIKWEKDMNLLTKNARKAAKFARKYKRQIEKKEAK